MFSKKRTTTTLVLRAIALACCLLALLLLLGKFAVSIEQDTYYMSEQPMRKENMLISSSRLNFFKFSDTLKSLGWSGGNQAFTTFLTITTIIAAVLVAIDVFRLLKEKFISNKVMKIILLAVSAFALITFIYAFVIFVTRSGRIVCNNDYAYTYGSRTMIQTIVIGRYSLTSVVVLSALAFLTQGMAGLFDLLDKSGERNDDDEADELAE